MEKRMSKRVGLVACVVLVGGSGWAGGGGAGESLRLVSSGFVENAGQWRTPARFVARTPDFVLGVGGDHLDLLTRGVCGDGLEQHLVRLTFVGADERAVVVPLEPLPGTHAFFHGRDPAGWRTGVREYASVLVAGLYPGVDLEVKQHPAGIEYDLILSPCADLDDVVIRCEGIDGLRASDDETLVLATAAGPIVQHSPTTWGEAGQRRIPIGCRYRVLSENEYAFTAHDWSALERLVIDPVLEWSSYLGGSAVDEIRDVAVDADGLVTAVGTTDRFFGLDFPVVPGSFFTSSFNVDVFVTRIDPSVPSLVFSAVFGSLENDEAHSVALGPAGEAFVAGLAGSSDFPVTPGAFDTTFGGVFLDAFLLRMNPNGSALLYSTFLGGSANELAAFVAVDEHGVATVAGETSSTDFPTTPGAFQETFGGGGGDAFVTRLSSDGGTALFSTFVGGSGFEGVNDVALLPGGHAGFVGATDSSDYPTTPNAFDSTNGNTQVFDAFVSRLSADGSTLVASTLLGGNSFDFAHAVTALPNGDMVVAGRTSSSEFPTTPGVLYPALGGVAGNFVTRVRASAGSLAFSTFLGEVSSPFTLRMDVTADASGVVAVTGGGGETFPVTSGSFDPVGSAFQDAFVSRVTPDAKGLLYSTYLTGSSGTSGFAIAERSDGVVVFAGQTVSTDFPTTPDATQGSAGGNSDAVVTVFDLLPEGVTRYGSASSSCLGPVRIGVLKVPEAGVPGFGFWSSQAPPGAHGFLVVSSEPNFAGTPLLGAVVHAALDDLPLSSRKVRSDRAGWIQTRMKLPATSAGQTIYAQYVWFGTPKCGTFGDLSASSGLAVTVQ